MIEEGDADQVVKRTEIAKLNALVGLAETVGCRRQAILQYFGESHAGNCGSCDTCRSPAATVDASVAAQKFLSAVYRTGQRFGAAYVIDVLRGKSSDKLRRNGHDKLPTFGIGADMDAAAWQGVLRQLVVQEAVVVDHDSFGALKLGSAARAILKGETKVVMREVRRMRATDVMSSLKASVAAKQQELAPEDEELFQTLKALRSELARQAGVPAYVVAQDTTLIAIARIKPADVHAMGLVPGFGQAKIAKYGPAFAAAVVGYLHENAPGDDEPAEAEDVLYAPSPGI